MRGLCAAKKAIGPRKRLDCSTLQSIADKEFANRDQARWGRVLVSPNSPSAEVLLLERKDLEFSTDLGVAWTDEQYRDSAFDDDFVTGILRWNFNQRLGPVFSVFQRAEYHPSLEEMDVMTVEVTTGLRSDLTRTFFLEAKMVWEYDSEPSTGVDRQDVDYLFSLGYRFD